MNCNEDDLKFAIRESLTGPAKEAPSSIEERPVKPGHRNWEVYFPEPLPAPQQSAIMKAAGLKPDTYHFVPKTREPALD